MYFLNTGAVTYDESMTNEEIIELLTQVKSVRRFYEMKDSFEKALKVKQMIFTDKEHARFKKNREKMLKDVKKIVENS